MENFDRISLEYFDPEGSDTRDYIQLYICDKVTGELGIEIGTDNYPGYWEDPSTEKDVFGNPRPEHTSDQPLSPQRDYQAIGIPLDMLERMRDAFTAHLARFGR